jgi:hypothetical protein
MLAIVGIRCYHFVHKQLADVTDPPRAAVVGWGSDGRWKIPPSLAWFAKKPLFVLPQRTAIIWGRANQTFSR